MSLNCDYSRLIRKCIKSSTQYIEVSEEKELTTKAIIMSMETHKRKGLTLNKGAHKVSGLAMKDCKPYQAIEEPNSINTTTRERTEYSRITEGRKKNGR